MHLHVMCGNIRGPSTEMGKDEGTELFVETWKRLMP